MRRGRSASPRSIVSAKLGIVAGAGGLPRQLIDRCRTLGREVFIVAINGETEKETVADVPHEWIDIAAVGRAIAALRRAGCEEVCFIGPVKRPNFGGLKPDWQGIKLLPKVIAAAREGDDAILTVVVNHVEASGFKVVGADDVLTQIAAPRGPLGRHRPSVEDEADIAKGIAVIHALGPFDVGQAAVVRAGQVLAIEAAEGTDAMLARCAALRAQTPRGVLVKCPKPAQERRVDLPTIGPRTIAGAAAAGLAGIALAAGSSLIAEREATVTAADGHGLFVIGVDAESEC